MPRTINANSTVGITLSSSTDNPVLVTATIDTTAGIALYGDVALAWTLTNQGEIKTSDTTATGVQLNGGGTVDNAAGAVISGGVNGIDMVGGGPDAVTNLGSIVATGTNGAAVGMFSATGNLVNNGIVSDPAADGFGAVLGGGGAVTNQGTGTIAGGDVGVQLQGTVGNSLSNGTGAVISGGTNGVLIILGPGTVSDAGLISGGSDAGMALDDGGAVSIGAPGTVTGEARGVGIYSAAGTLTNDGSIGSTSTLGDAVFMTDGGSVVNATGAHIGTIGTGINIGGGAGSVVNAGSITGSGTAGVEGVALGDGGSVTNEAGGVIAGYYAAIALAGTAASVFDDGIITGNGGGNAIGIRVNDGAYVSIGGSGTVSGNSLGMDFFNAAGTITNAGSIAGKNSAGIVLNAGGTLSNTGTGALTGASDGLYAFGVPATVIDAGQITGTGRIGINLRGGGSVGVSGGVTGSADGIAIGAGPGTVTNSGDITATSTSGAGIALTAGGTVTNAAGGSIQGGGGGVYFSGGAGTVVNGGTIASGGVDAVDFAASFANRMVVDPGAAFGGIVDGGNTIGATADSTLELASAGTTAGTIGGLGSSFVNFAAVTIDSGGTWSLAGDNALAAGASIANAGSLIVAGSLVNAGSIAGGVLVGTAGHLSNASGGAISGTFAVNLPVFGVSFDNAGSLSGTVAVEFLGYYTAFGIGSVAGTMTNEGYISGSSTGVVLSLGQQLTNGAHGVILGGSEGIVEYTALRDPVGIDNAGTISVIGGTTAAAIFVKHPASIVNEQSGLINSTGADIQGSYYSGDVIINDGTIANSSTYDNPALNDPAIPALGVQLTNGSTGKIFSQYQGVSNAISLYNAGTIFTRDLAVDTVTLSNAATGIITSQSTVAVKTFGTGTVTDAGTIAAAGTNGSAVQFVANYAGRMIVDPGANFIGAIDGGNTIGASAVSVLELAAGRGTLADFTNFGSITFDTGAAWKISDPAAGLAGGQLISGFSPGDTIEITGVTASKTALVGDTLALSGGLDLVLPGNTYTYAQFQTTNSGGNTDVTVACFAAGARILTDGGEIAVEALQPGMRVVSLTHRRAVAVKWIASRAVGRAAPVRVAVGAFGNRLPHRSLHLSPDHAVFVGGALIPVRTLVNGTTITEIACESVTYFHVELQSHAVLLAEGLPAESYLDTGNRSALTPAHPASQADALHERGSRDAENDKRQYNDRRHAFQ